MYLEESIKTMLESTPTAYSLHKVIYNKKNNVIDYETLEYNPAFLNIIGIHSDEINDNLINEFIFKIIKDIPEIEKGALNAIREDKSTTFQDYIPSYHKWLNFHIFPSKKDHFIIQIADITKEKELENKFKKRSQELSLIFNSINDLIIAVNYQGIIININNTWERLLGYEANEVIGKYFYEFLPENIYNKILSKFKDESLFQPNYVFRTKIPSKNGSTLTIEWKSAIYEDLVYSVGRDVTALIKTEEKIFYLSYHDKLTGLYNRAFFEVELERLDNNRNLPFSIIMGDVNGLKLINDVFGHLAGDKLLKDISNILSSSIRKGDILSRWGGDEFIILLPNTSEEITKEIINRIRKKCENNKIELQYGDISLGYAIKNSSKESVTDVLVKAESNMYKNKSLDGKKTRNNIVSSMLKQLYKDDFENQSNLNRLKFHLEEFGKELNLSLEDIERLFLLAEFHDIGLVSVPRNILNKSTELSKEEWKEIETHSESGYRIAKAIPELSHIANNILYHHEKWDGSGYPKGLKEKEIPYLNRVFSIADVYNSLLQKKSHRPPLSKEEAIDFLRRFKGIYFETELVNIFLNRLEEKKF